MQSSWTLALIKIHTLSLLYSSLYFLWVYNAFSSSLKTQCIKRICKQDVATRFLTLLQIQRYETRLDVAKCIAFLFVFTIFTYRWNFRPENSLNHCQHFLTGRPKMIGEDLIWNSPEECGMHNYSMG